MSLTPSTMLELGSAAPDFDLPDTKGRRVKRDDFRGSKGLLVIFMCNHCPYVIHIRETLAAVTKEYRGKGIETVAINANDASNYPADSPQKMVTEAVAAGYQFPYLYDETQTVAKAYKAACTPDFFLFNGSFNLVYRGQFDDSRPGNERPVTGADLTAALDQLLSGQAIREDQIPSVGCNIKWKEGNAPDYF